MKLSFRRWAYAGDWRRSYRRLYVGRHWTPFVFVRSI